MDEENSDNKVVPVEALKVVPIDALREERAEREGAHPDTVLLENVMRTVGQLQLQQPPSRENILTLVKELTSFVALVATMINVEVPILKHWRAPIWSGKRGGRINNIKWVVASTWNPLNK